MDMENKRIALDSRLNALAELLGRCPVYVDIGCDHGRLGAFVLQRGWVRKAYLTDISADSLSKARALIRLLGLEDRVQFAVCNGVPDIRECPDAVVIAGMGGALISEILLQGKERLGGARLLLQANVALPQMRQTLTDIGYAITEERIVRDGRRLYVIVEARPGTARYTRRELIAGPVLLERRPPLLKEYAAFRIRVAEKAMAGAQRGQDAESIRMLAEELEIWRGVPV